MKKIFTVLTILLLSAYLSACASAGAGQERSERVEEMGDADLGIHNLNVYINTEESINDYINRYPHLIAISLNRLADASQIDNGVVLYYDFNNATGILQGLTIDINRNNNHYAFMSFLTEWIKNGYELREELSTDGWRMIYNLTPFMPEETYDILRVLLFNSNNNELKLLFYIDYK